VSFDADGYLSSCTYTIGFWETLGVPEVVLCGQPSKNGNGVLRDICQALKSSEVKLAEYERWPVPVEAGKFVWREVHPSQWIPQNFATGFWYREHRGQPQPPTAFQIVASDLGGHLPWEPGYDERYRHEQYSFYEPRSDAERARDSELEARVRSRSAS
jgi:hypothetical protein